MSGFDDDRGAQQAQQTPPDTGIVQIKRKGGVVKDYMTVPLRIKNFWADEAHKGWSIRTKILHLTEEFVVVQCKIKDAAYHTMATGHAEEIRGSSDINATSALENCETSAIGRALAALGLGGSSFASAEEVIGSQQKQEEFSDLKKFFKPLFELAAREGTKFLGDCWAKPALLEKFASSEAWSTMHHEDGKPKFTAIEVKRALKSELIHFKDIASRCDNAERKPDEPRNQE